MRKLPKCTLLNRANYQAGRRKTFHAMRRQATQRCPDCKARVTIEMGTMRCTVCDWSVSIHDVA